MDMRDDRPVSPISSARWAAAVFILPGFYTTLLVPMRIAPAPEVASVPSIAVLSLVGVAVGLRQRRADPAVAVAGMAAGSLAALGLQLVVLSILMPVSAMEPGAWRATMAAALVTPPATLALTGLIIGLVRRHQRASLIGASIAGVMTAGGVAALLAFADGAGFTIRPDTPVLTVTLRDDAIVLQPATMDAGFVTVLEVNETTRPRELEWRGPLDQATIDRLVDEIASIPPDPAATDYRPDSRPVVCCRPTILPGRNVWVSYGYPPVSEIRVVSSIAVLDVRLGPEGLGTPPEDRYDGPRFVVLWAVLAIHGLGVAALWQRRAAAGPRTSATSTEDARSPALATAVAVGATALPIVWVLLALELARNPF